MPRHCSEWSAVAGIDCTVGQSQPGSGGDGLTDLPGTSTLKMRPFLLPLTVSSAAPGPLIVVHQ